MPLPENTCAYERYDPETLEPLNDETYIRLQELGWSAEDFEGQTVLDIGCNSGLLTIHALRLGASKVAACDVQVPFVQFFSDVVRNKKLPVTVSLTPFAKLEPTEQRSDVVLFMEVLHWAVSQGIVLREVIRRLASLTDKLLYIEFPWSVSEPSIQKQTKLTAEDYSADAVLDELTRYFKHVRVVRFMRYFGFESKSQRVLIEARGKRPEASILEQLQGVHSLDVALSRGRNESYLLASPAGPLVAKLLAPENRIADLPESLSNRLFDELKKHEPKTLVVPEKRGDGYLLPAPEGRSWMLFPFVGPLPSAGKAKNFPIDFDLLIELLINVRRDFRSLTAETLDRLREHGFFPSWKSVASPDAPWASPNGALESVREAALQLLAETPDRNETSFDALCHGDLQTGNFVFDRSKHLRVVDLDNLGLGTIYSDGLTALIWRGVTEELLVKYCRELEAEEERPVKRFDIAVAVANGLGWYSTVRTTNPAALQPDQIARLRNGLGGALDFAKAC